MTDELIEKAKTNHKLLKKLKCIAVEAKLYELGVQLREMEQNLFPETEESKQAKKDVQELDLLFRMVNLSVPDKELWTIGEAMKVYRKKKGKFDVSDAALITVKARELFD
jgi:hypothetical protein